MKKACFLLLIALFLSEAIYAEPVHTKFYYKKKTSLAYPATYSFRFSLWTTETGGTEPVWSEDKDIHMTNNSISTYLGDTISFESVPVDFSEQYWVQVERKKKSTGAYVPVGIRDKLGVVPYALWSEASIVQVKYANVAVVAQGGGDYTDPVTAMNDLSIWCGTPSATNPCLLKIMPGVYDIGANTLQMQNYVDVEGSGEKNTTITGSNTAGSHSGVVNGASNAELRFLTVRNIGGGLGAVSIYNYNTSPKITHVTANAAGGTDTVIAIVNYGGVSPVLTNVTATASGGSNYCQGIANNSSSPVMTNVKATASGSAYYVWGIYNLNSSSPVTNNVTAVASGGTVTVGVFNNGSSPTMTNLTATATNGASNLGISNYQSCSPTMFNVVASASGGTINYGFHNGTSSGTVKIDHSLMSGSTNAIYNSTGVSVYVANTKLDGGPVSNTGDIKCIGTYDGNYNALNGTCQ